MVLLLLLLPLLFTVQSDDCGCARKGTIASLACEDNGCLCKPRVEPSLCNVCPQQHYNLSSVNVFGCMRCTCDMGGSVSLDCDQDTGQCQCKEGVTGRDCDRPSNGSYVPTLYHIKGNLVLGESVSALNVRNNSLNIVLDPKDIPNIPPLFSVLFDSYPLPVTAADLGGNSRQFEQQESLKRKGRSKRSLFTADARYSNIEERGRTRRDAEERGRARRDAEEPVTHTTTLSFPKSGVYFIVLNYTAPTTADVELILGSVSIPTSLPACDNCLIMAAGTLGVKGVQVQVEGEQLLTVHTPKNISIFYAVALPQDYYFTTSLKQDVGVRCSVGPFTEVCNWYKYPDQHQGVIEVEAEDWLNPATQPAYTGFTGVNLFGLDNTLSSGQSFRSTYQLTMSVNLNPGTSYYLILKYYRPYTTESNRAEIRINRGMRGYGDVEGSVEILPCPWLLGCRSPVTDANYNMLTFTASLSSNNVVLSVEEDFIVFVDSMLFVAVYDFDYDMVQPQFYCIQGPTGECMKMDFMPLTDYVFYESESAIDAKKIELEGAFYHGTGVLLLDKNTPSFSIVLMENTIQRNESENYILIVHYYKKTKGMTKGRVNIYDDTNSSGDVRFPFCPSASGCRVAATKQGWDYTDTVSHNPALTGHYTPLPVTGGNSRIIVSLSLLEDDLVYVDYIAMVPHTEFTVDMLFALPFNHGPLFTYFCAYHYLYVSPCHEMEEYCSRVVFTMTTDFLNGTKECRCSDTGAKSTKCQDGTGQCKCRKGYKGVTCEQCNDSYYGYPKCKACNCNKLHSNSTTCEAESGQCECKENFGGKTCGRCTEGRYNKRGGCVDECKCGVQGSEELGCQDATGICSCKANIEGAKCDECNAGHYRFPLCYTCSCDKVGSVSSECSLTGECTCKAGYTGAKCEVCDQGYYDNQGQCSQCECSTQNTTCSVEKLYVHQISSTFSGTTREGFMVTDRTQTRTSSNHLTVIKDMLESPGNMMMYDLEKERALNYLSLPVPYLGNQSTATSLSLDMNILIGQSKVASIELIFKSADKELVYSYTEYMPGDMIKLRIRVPLSEAQDPRWSSADNSTVSSTDIAAVLSELTAVLVKLDIIQGQVVSLVGNIALSFTSSLPSPTPAPGKVTCDCYTGYQGDSCQHCEDTYMRGESGKCDTLCQCNGKADKCTEAGVCLDCQRNTGGDQCQECNHGYYEDAGGECVKCPCPSSYLIESGSCSIDNNDVTCDMCPEGYTGDNCQECVNGYYGKPLRDVLCRPCQCNDRLNMSVGNACHKATGQCLVCIDQYSGPGCGLCAEGYYGDTCQECQCNVAGSVDASCNGNGVCQCKGSIRGNKCDECLPGSFISKSTCRPCNCAGLSSLNSYCNISTGQCECDPGYGGRKCDQCAEGYTLHKDKCKPCGCSAVGTETCTASGDCECKPGYHGNKCTQCTGYYTTKNEGDCQVCDECPLLLLDSLKNTSFTLDDLTSNNEDQAKLDKIRARAQEIQDSLETPEDITPILLSLNYTVQLKDNVTDTARQLQEHSYKTLADATDHLRAVVALQAHASALPTELQDIKDSIENFNPDPSGMAGGVKEAKAIIKEMKEDDIMPLLKEARRAKKAGKQTNKLAESMVPSIPTMPDLTEVIARVDKAKEWELEVDEEGVRQQALELAAIELEEAGVKAELARIQAVKDNITEPDLQTVQEMLDTTQIPDLGELASTVAEMGKSVAKLTPLPETVLANCSGLHPRNLSAEDTGPRFLREMIEAEKRMKELNQSLVDVQGLGDKVERMATPLIADIEHAKTGSDKLMAWADKTGSEMTNLQLALLPDVVVVQEKYNKGNQTRLDKIVLPVLPDMSPPESSSEPLTDPLDYDAMEDKIDKLKGPDADITISDMLPVLFNNSDTAGQMKSKVVETSKRIDYRLRDLWDKINRAKRSVESLLIPMRFSGEESFAKYPIREVLDNSGYVNIKAVFKTEKSSATGDLIYLTAADQGLSKRDTLGNNFLSLELSSGQMICNVSVGSEWSAVVSDDTINVGEWNSIEVERRGRNVHMWLNNGDKQSVVLASGDTLGAGTLIIGKGNTGTCFKGSVNDVYVNDIRVSQWLSAELQGVDDSELANRLILKDQTKYFFNGDNAYLAINPPPQIRYRNRPAILSLRTASTEGLILFSADGAGSALDMYAIDMLDGKMRFHYSIKGGTVVTRAIDGDFSDLKTRQITTYLTSSGAVGIKTPFGNLRESEKGIEIKAQSVSTFIGMVPPSVHQKYNQSLFAPGTIVSTPFGGCISDIFLNSKAIYSSYITTARNVQNGCSDKLVSRISMRSTGGVTLMSTPVGDISMLLATADTEAMLLYMGNSESEYISITLDKGRVVVTIATGDKVYMISSNALLNTASKRSIRVELGQGRVMLLIDDIAENSAILDQQMFTLNTQNKVYLGYLPADVHWVSVSGYSGCIDRLIIGDHIVNFALHTTAKSDVITDRCRVIYSQRGTEEVELLQVAACSPLSSSLTPDSMLFSSTRDVTSHMSVTVSLPPAVGIKSSMSLALSTLSSSGTLLYSQNSDSTQYIALTLLQGKVHLSVKLGDSSQAILVSDTKVSDGYTHKISAKRTLNMLELNVDNEIQRGRIIGQVIQFRQDSTVYVGGVPDTIPALQPSPSFVGCLSEVTLDSTRYTLSDGEIVGSVIPCVQSVKSNAHYFGGNSSIIPDTGTGSKVSLSFRSSRQTGDIVRLESTEGAVLFTVRLDNDLVQVASVVTSALIPLADPMYICNGKYHTLTMNISQSAVTVQVDDLASVTVETQLLDNSLLRLGDNFIGCMKDMAVDDSFISLLSPIANLGVALQSCPQ